MTKSWIEYDTWNELFKDRKAYNQYLIERDRVQNKLNFNWSNIWTQLKPKLYTNKEWTGLISYRKKSKSLYISKILSSNKEQVSKSANQKLKNKVTYFIFHTHPCNIKYDPLPSDSDIFMALKNSFNKETFGEVLVSEYGIFIYYLPSYISDKIYKINGELGFYMFCYDVLSTWNSHSSMHNISLNDRLNLLKKFGISIHHIPSDKYIEDNKHKYTSKIIYTSATGIMKYIQDKIDQLRSKKN